MNTEKSVDIILIEDNPSDVELTMRALKKANITNKVTLLKDGEEAMNYLFPKNGDKEKYALNTPMLILLDLRLPKVDGLEILKELKSREETKIIPVVVLTSSKEEKDLVESYRLGVNSFVTKPLDFDKFMKAVNELALYWTLINKAPEPKL